ncbi:Hypothetical protein POVR2_LOCUS389 [uncultured virus]|nr:Hypothetical protein POVR2_LOCUS389 [uncultured virus]
MSHTPIPTQVAAKNKLLSKAMYAREKDMALISTLLEDKRVDKRGNRALAALTRSVPSDPIEYINLLLNSKNLDREKVPDEVLKRVGEQSADSTTLDLSKLTLKDSSVPVEDDQASLD